MHIINTYKCIHKSQQHNKGVDKGGATITCRRSGRFTTESCHQQKRCTIIRCIKRLSHKPGNMKPSGGKPLGMWTRGWLGRAIEPGSVAPGTDTDDGGGAWDCGTRVGVLLAVVVVTGFPLVMAFTTVSGLVIMASDAMAMGVVATETASLCTWAACTSFHSCCISTVFIRPDK